MNWILKGFGILYHIWFFVVVFISIVLILPFIYITSLRETQYHYFFKWMRRWGFFILGGMGLFPSVEWKFRPKKDEQYIIIANHSSEIDIMMTLALVPGCFVFIGKKELAKIPLFGYFYKKTNILVDRKSLTSKKNVLKRAAEKIAEGTGVCIYPEGGIPNDPERLSAFKMGAFKLAVEQGIPILPIVFPNNRKHFPDFTQGGYPGILKARVLPPIPTKDISLQNLNELKQKCFDLLDTNLEQMQS